MTPRSYPAYRTQLVVGLTPALAADVDDGTASVDAAQLTRLSQDAGVTLRSQGIRSEDGEIVWYASELVSRDPAAAEMVATSLRDVRGVAAAYLKPLDSAP